MRALKAPQRSVKIKISVDFFFFPGLGRKELI